MISYVRKVNDATWCPTCRQVMQVCDDSLVDLDQVFFQNTYPHPCVQVSLQRSTLDVLWKYTVCSEPDFSHLCPLLSLPATFLSLCHPTLPWVVHRTSWVPMPHPTKLSLPSSYKVAHTAVLPPTSCFSCLSPSHPPTTLRKDLKHNGFKLFLSCSHVVPISTFNRQTQATLVPMGANKIQKNLGGK